MSCRAGKIGSVLVLATSTALAVADRARSWAGSSVDEHSAGRTTGDSAIAVIYRLTVTPGRGTRDCLLRNGGFQTNETLVCKIEGDAAAITVGFHTDEDGPSTSTALGSTRSERRCSAWTGRMLPSSHTGRRSRPGA